MIGPAFAVVLGVALLSLSFVAVAYVVWVRIVGLDPTLGQQFAALSKPAQSSLVICLGLLLGAGAQIAPNVRAGVAGAVMFGAAVFAALIFFEVYGAERTTRETLLATERRD